MSCAVPIRRTGVRGVTDPPPPPSIDIAALQRQVAEAVHKATAATSQQLQELSDAVAQHPPRLALSPEQLKLGLRRVNPVPAVDCPGIGPATGTSRRTLTRAIAVDNQATGSTSVRLRKRLRSNASAERWAPSTSSTVEAHSQRPEPMRAAYVQARINGCVRHCLLDSCGM